MGHRPHIQYQNLNSNMKVDDLENFATIENNCSVIECTSENAHGQGANILSPVRKRLWMSTDAPPQVLILDLNNLQSRPKQCFNVFGIDCWYDYLTNPKDIQISASSDGKKFQWESRILCKREANWQFFSVNEIPKGMRFIKIKVVSNFGEETTYINQILLSYRQPQSDQIQMYLPTKEALLEKGYKASQTHQMNQGRQRLASNEDKLKAIQQKVEVLEGQNRRLEFSNDSLSTRVSGLQKTIDTLLRQFQVFKSQTQWSGQQPDPVSHLELGYTRIKATSNQTKMPLPSVPRMSSCKHQSKYIRDQESSGSELSNYEVATTEAKDKSRDNKVDLLKKKLQKKILQRKQVQRKLQSSTQRRATPSDCDYEPL